MESFKFGLRNSRRKRSRKCSASVRTSSPRSLSGGIVMGTAAIRKYKSSRNFSLREHAEVLPGWPWEARRFRPEKSFRDWPSPFYRLYGSRLRYKRRVHARTAHSRPGLRGLRRSSARRMAARAGAKDDESRAQTVPYRFRFDREAARWNPSRPRVAPVAWLPAWIYVRRRCGETRIFRYIPRAAANSRAAIPVA